MTLFPTKKREGFDECVGLTRLVMSIAGIWPETLSQRKGPLRYSYVMILTFLVLFFLIIPQAIKLYVARNDINEVMDIITLGIIVVSICLLKLLGLVMNTNDLRHIIGMIREDWRIATTEEQVIMWRNAKLSRLIASVCFVLTYNNCTMLYMRVLMHNYFSSGENGTVDRPMILNSQFFFEYQKSPNYEVLLFVQYISCLAAATAFNSFDGLFVFSVLHVTGQFYNLRAQIEDAAKMESQDGFKKRLGGLVRRHQHLNHYIALLEDNFNKLFLLQNVATAVLMCFQAYFFIMYQSSSNNYIEVLPELIFTVTYIATSLFSVFAYCYFAEQLRTETEDLYTSMYKMKWYELRSEESKLLVMFMINTLKPVELTVGKLTPLSLAYYCSIIKSSGGYLSMLLAMKDND